MMQKLSFQLRKGALFNQSTIYLLIVQILLWLSSVLERKSTATLATKIESLPIYTATEILSSREP